MEMNDAVKAEAEKAAEHFLNTMPKQNFERYKKQKLHHQLAYFYSWCTIIQKAINDGEI